jgi:hypothetical protein
VAWSFCRDKATTEVTLVELARRRRRSHHEAVMHREQVNNP